MTTQVLFNTDDKTFAVEVQHINPHVVRILDALGAEQTLYDSGFELNPTSFNVLICGDDSYGSVTHISVCNGHLILIANFGDNGDLVFSPTTSGEVDNDLPSELIELMDEDCTLASYTLYINSLDKYTIGQHYDCSAI